MGERHPITGCRADTLFGSYLAPVEHLDTWVNSAWAIIESGELKMYSDRSKEMEEQKEKLFTVQDRIAHLQISGPMTKHPTSFQSLFGGTSTVRMREALREVRQMNQAGVVDGVFIEADSWGGTAEGTAELAESIRQTDKQLPVWVHAPDKSTSACLWPSTQARRFTCGPTACIGSQGVMLEMWDRSGQASEGKVRPVIFSTGEFKTIGAPGVPLTEKQRAEVQRRVNGVNEPFKQDVIRGRNLNSAQAEEVATARIFVGQDAKRVGLVDDVCSTEQALQGLKDLIAASARRGPEVVKPSSAAPNRSNAMAKFTAEQLVQARSLPGAANLTEETAETRVLEIALQQTGQTGTVRQELETSKQENTTLKQQLQALQARVPVQTDSTVLAGLGQNALDRLELMVEKGVVTVPQKDLLAKAFMGDNSATPNPTMLQGAVSKTVFDLLQMNKPSGVTTPISGAQPAPKQTPGADAEGGKKQKMSFERMNELRSMQGLAPMTMKDFRERYPDEA